MRVLVTGVKGQLGYDVVNELKKRGITEILSVDREEMDLTNEDSVKKVTLGYQPDWIIHCAAWTQVDNAEENQEACFNVNVLGTRTLSECAKVLSCKMIYISTDYVFNGEGTTPFKETDTPMPLNHYGITKYLGEKEVVENVEKYFIARISWVFGYNGNNFIKTMLKLGKERKELNVVCDQIGSPTYTYDLAKVLIDMIETDKYGIYHITNEGYTSWYEFAKFIFKEVGMDVAITPILTKDYKTKARRPLNSRMSKDKLKASGFNTLPQWEDAVIRYLKALGVIE